MQRTVVIIVEEHTTMTTLITFKALLTLPTLLQTFHTLFYTLQILKHFGGEDDDDEMIAQNTK